MNPIAGDDDGSAITTDTLLRGRVTLLQPARGYRSSLDPVLLAAFVLPPFGRFLDLGCGTGALAFLLAARDPVATGVGVEIQPRLARLAAEGLGRNRFADRLRILQADARTLNAGPLDGAPAVGGRFDLVASNPPYRPLDSGPPSPDGERAQAHHELTLTLDQFLDTARRLVDPRGRVAVVYPAARAQALLAGLSARALAVARLRPVHPRSDQPASRVLVEARAGGGTTLRQQSVQEPPLVVHRADGGFSPEVQAMVGDDVVW